MIDERLFIQRIERAGIEEFAQLLARPSSEEESALRAYFGDQRFRTLHAMALRQRVRRTSVPEGNVVFIHGIMGGELTAYRGGTGKQIWARPLALVSGEVTRLRLAGDGRTDFEHGTQVQATGIMKSAYAEMLIALTDRWNVRGFWFDWRKDISLAAAELATRIDGWFGPKAPVHLVAHSMGGLVSRALIRDYPDRWNRMWDANSPRKGSRGGRLVMIGTPNHGSFAIPQVIMGIEAIVRKIAVADLCHSLEELLPVFNSFVGSYQMLPSPYVMKGYDWLYKAESYRNVSVPQALLDNAKDFHDSLRDVIDPKRMSYVAGFNKVTFNGLTNTRRPDLKDSYSVTRNGDGRVPHVLGFLNGVQNYFAEEAHGDLAANERVIAATEDLLETGTTSALTKEVPKSRAEENRKEDRNAIWRLQDREVQEVAVLAKRTCTRSEASTASTKLADDEQALRDRLMADVVPTARAKTARAEPVIGQEPVVIKLALIHGLIQKTEVFDRADVPVDAISVGHYIGVRPLYAEQALDIAISQALANPSSGGSRKPMKQSMPPSNGILAQYAARGTLRGELGQPFFLQDPRWKGHPGKGRVIAIAGMGYPGRFGEPELTVAARELCWSLGRMGKRHLASVLIGGGVGNMSIKTAVNAWIRGVRQALIGSPQDFQYHLERLTFVESDPRRALEIHRTIQEEVSQRHAGVTVEYETISKSRIASLGKEGRKRAQEDWLEDLTRQGSSNSALTRLTIELDQDVYRFGAITETASIPERNIPLDPLLVMRANDELIKAGDTQVQRERGELLGKLLVPSDLRTKLASSAPIIMSMDAATARIHWELIAHDASADNPLIRNDADANLYLFLGTSRGLTRQLRTTYAPPPEPPPPPRRLLRVLVVADPAEDAHLPGAEEEGAAIAELFRSFNTVYGDRTKSSVEVVALFGPSEATRTNVLGKLMTSQFDILHFAGHCRYATETARSGWIFSGGEVLSANELNRIDRVPKFVFSNACESGVMPDRPGDRNVHLAPSFAESFFARGVSNFVCTAWPVDDVAAREFSLAVYGGVLGLRQIKDQPGRYEAVDPLPMHEAMRQARRSVANSAYGARTWGAYQHYGNPYLQLFNASDLDTLEDSPSVRSARQKAKRAAGTKRRGATLRPAKSVAKRRVR